MIFEGMLNCHEAVASTQAINVLNTISTETVNSVGMEDLGVSVNKCLEKQTIFFFPGHEFTCISCFGGFS